MALLLAGCAIRVTDELVEVNPATGSELPGPAGLKAPPWPEWILQHWVWEDENTQESATQLVEGYLSRGIPVGAVIIDSPWATGYGAFDFDPRLFPDPKKMIDDFHARQVRVLLWTVSNINIDSPNWNEALTRGYLASGGRTLNWWKGEGAFIDYNNPEALAWWHEQMDKALDLGIDGWKCDGTVPLAKLWLGIGTQTGRITTSSYQDLYYADFFHYTRARLGPGRVITARPVDNAGLPFDMTYAKRDINFAGWVGDQDPTWRGMKTALKNMFESAEKGYVYFGSDIGGYRENIEREKILFVRWAQLGALSPIMENGGMGEHRPWRYGQYVLGIYRDFVKLHHALIPYLYSEGAELYPQEISVMRPTSRRRYEYMLGCDLFVAPLVEPSPKRTIHFPDGDTWIAWWSGEEYEGGEGIELDFPLSRYPLFVRKGAIIPMDIPAKSVFGPSKDDLNPLTIFIYPKTGETEARSIYEEQGRGARVEADYRDDGLTIRLSATQRRYAFRVMDMDKPRAVITQPCGPLQAKASFNELFMSSSGFFYDEKSWELWIKPGPADNGLIVEVR